jgi:hypothetical protein
MSFSELAGIRKEEATMDGEFELPFITSAGWMAFIFVLALAIFHGILVYLWPLGKIGWKKVDYIWISFALIGVFAAISESRQIFARGTKIYADARLVGSFERIRSDLDVLSSSGVICRQFARSDFSPPPEVFERIQQQHNLACERAKELSSQFPQSLSDIQKEIDLKQFEPDPNITDRIVKLQLQRLQNSATNFNRVWEARQKLAKQLERNDFEIFLVIISPLLIVLAVALRLTKVTGEIKVG